MKKKNCRNGNGEIFNIPPYLIKPNPSLARTDFSDTALASLADSIRRYGILQPLAVRISENGRYELVAGERRLRAALLLGMQTVPCVILETDSGFEYLSVVENIQREKLNMFDEARAVRRLFERSGRDISGTAKLLSLSESDLKRKLALCGFSRAEMQAILNLGINEREAEAFLCVPSNLRYYTIKLCAEKNYSCSETQALCRAIQKEEKLTPDDLESFAQTAVNADETEKQEEEQILPQKTKSKIVLRDLHAFEISLQKICSLLENAGCNAGISKNEKNGKTVYTVTVETV